jgi:uncharacterized protein YijF (DUF1287 family)
MKVKYFFCLFLFSSGLTFSQNTFQAQLAEGALSLIKQKVVYDPAYFKIQYPNGDVPSGKGVCTDVIIRAYRSVGIDLQQLVHEDMKGNFNQYPKLWQLTRPDTNIDHRRVPNLMQFFSRHGSSLKTLKTADDYKPGDVIVWSLGGGVRHIGIVVNQKSNDGLRPLIVHNIGNGQELSDCLFNFPIIAHYQYPPP